MTRGKKWTDEQRGLAEARITLGDSCEAVARDLNIPAGTIRCWKMELDQREIPEERLEYYSEDTKKFSERAWRTIHKGLKKIEKGLDEFEITKAYDVKQIALAIGILYDKAIRALPEVKPGEPRPIDLTHVSTEHLRLIVADIRRTTEILQEEGIIKGEAKEVKE